MVETNLAHADAHQQQMRQENRWQYLNKKTASTLPTGLALLKTTSHQKGIRGTPFFPTSQKASQPTDSTPDKSTKTTTKNATTNQKKQDTTRNNNDQHKEMQYLGNLNENLAKKNIWTKNN